MTIIDRYILKLFLKVLVVCFISLTGLYVVIDIMNNVDDLIVLGNKNGGFLHVLCDYYLGKVFLFFDMTNSLLTMLAAIFAIVWIHKSNELSAIMAGGIPARRVIRPVVIAAIFVSVIAAINRETLIPAFRESLVLTVQTYDGDNGQSMVPQFDNQTQIYLSGQTVHRNERKIVNPNFVMPQNLRGIAKKIAADEAYFVDANQEHPSGFIFHNVSSPESINELAAIHIDQQLLLATSKDMQWLEPNQCFVASQLEFQHLAVGDSINRYLTTSELVRGLRNPSVRYGGGQRVMLHTRFLQPILDFSVVLIGLPLMLAQRDRNLFVGAAWCLLLVAVFVMVNMGSQSLGATGIIQPAVGAWLPLLIFGPLAIASFRTIDY